MREGLNWYQMSDWQIFIFLHFPAHVFHRFFLSSLQNTEYRGEYWADNPTIKAFWEVFHELSLEKKKLFLCKCHLLQIAICLIKISYM